MAGKGGAAAAGRGRGAGAQRQRQAAAQPLRVRGSAGGDIIGLVIAVIAIAMMISLASPSDAPVTSAVGSFLTLCFGQGAFLFPASLLIFAITFFIDADEPISGKVALGLCLIMVSVLSIISLNMPGAEDDPSLVVSMENVGYLGGYTGGGVAWGLLTLVGVWVGNVLLGGVIAVGIVICGFSVSGLVTRIRYGAGVARESMRDARVERRAIREERASERRMRAEARRQERAFAQAQAYEQQAQAYAQQMQASPWDEGAGYGEAPMEPATSFIGSRKTSVLTRSPQRSQMLRPLPEEFQGAEQVSEAATRVLRGRGAEPVVDEPTFEPSPADQAFAQPMSFAEAVQQELPTIMDTDAEAAFELPWEDPRPQRPTRTRKPAVEEAAVEEEPAEADLSVPGFLQQGRRSRTSTRRSSTPAATSEALRSSKRPQTTAQQPAKASTDEAAQAKRTRTKKKAAPKAAPKASTRPGDGDEGYELPPFSMLSSNPRSATSASSDAELEETKARLQSTLAEFGLTSRVVAYTSGPLVTTFQVEMGEGERVNKITNLQDDIALSLAAKSVRIFAPIPGTSRVGIEIPNKARQNVHLGDVLPYAQESPLEFAIGRDAEGGPVTADLAQMPHLLVAGATGSGKSVVINSLIMSLLMRATPKQVRLILVDPKRVEFSCYNGLPHLYVPVVTDPRQAASALQWAVSEMERRLKVFERAGARNINIYNEMCVSGKLAEMNNPPDPMPYMVIIIDELADLMMVAGKDVEASIVRIAQLARAAGIHLVLATQRPSANVVTGLIKSNIETRIALSVASGTDSRVILDQVGAQRLLGKGDMLFKERGGLPRRALGCFVSDPEIESVVDFIRDQAEPDYHEEILSAVVPGQAGGGGGASDVAEDDDPLVWEAAQIVVESQLGSTSGLQRRLKVGYARAGRIMDMLESKGVVGPPDGSKPREVLLDLAGLEELRTLEATYREV